MGDLKDWLTSVGAVSAAVISAAILLRMKLGDRRAERNKIVREKLEQVFLMVDLLVENCRSMYINESTHALALAAKKKAPDSEVKRHKTNRRKTGMVVRVYLPDLTPAWADFLDAHSGFEAEVFPFFVQIAKNEMTKADLGSFLPKVTSAFKRVEAAQVKFEDALIEKANSLL